MFKKQLYVLSSSFFPRYTNKVLNFVTFKNVKKNLMDNNSSTVVIVVLGLNEVYELIYIKKLKLIQVSIRIILTEHFTNI